MNLNGYIAAIAACGAAVFASAESGFAESSREFWVDHEKGDDANPGTRARPFRTFEKARAALRGGDRLNVVPTQTPYTEPLGWFRQELHSGTPGRPTVVDGHGARLSGLRTVEPNVWTNTGNCVWKMRFLHNVVCMSEKGFYDGYPFVFLDGQPVPMAKSLGEMKAGEAFLHLYYDPKAGRRVSDFYTLYLRLPEGKTPADFEIRLPHVAAARIFCDWIVFENFTCDWTSMDFFDTERRQGIVIRNVRTDHTMDQGVSSHSTAGCTVADSDFRRSLSGGALDVTLEPNTHLHMAYTNCTFREMREGMGIGIGCQGVGSNVTYSIDDCIFRDCATAAIRVQQGARVTVRRAKISNPGGAARETTAAFEIGPVCGTQTLSVFDSVVRDCPVGVRYAYGRTPSVFTGVDFSRVTCAAQILGPFVPGSLVFCQCAFPAGVRVLDGRKVLSVEQAKALGVVFADCTFGQPHGVPATPERPALAIPFPMHPGAAAETAPRERKIYAHYMGGMTAGTGPCAWHRKQQAKEYRLQKDYATMVGGQHVAWPLVPDGGDWTSQSMTQEENALMEMKRAIRAGISGFVIDAWASSDYAKKQLEVFIRTAEKHKLPFEMTICFDPSCHGCMPGKNNLEKYIATGRYVMSFRNSPNLARYDGKPLFFGYFSSGIAGGTGRIRKGMTLAEREAAIKGCWDEFRAAMGEPVFIHGSVDGDVDLKLVNDNPYGEIGRLAACIYDAVGGFLGGDFDWRFATDLPKAVRAAGKVWSQPMFHQYSNMCGGIMTGAGFDMLRANWKAAIESESDLIQYVTWNDYGEATELSPNTMTGYTVARVNKWYVDCWKNRGREPTVTEDEIHVVFRNVVGDRPPFPFYGRNLPVDEKLEVVTILTKPGRVTVDGYGEYEAPAGMSYRQFPLKVGKIAAKVVRDGRVACALVAPEEVSDRPWREHTQMFAYGSNFDREWKRDFPNAPVEHYSEMGDADGDGLPNWFEMVYFGAFPQMSSATAADPAADPDEDGFTNLEEYRNGTHPLKADTPYAAGFVWDTRQLTNDTFGVFNPHRDVKRSPVWFWFYEKDGAKRKVEFTAAAARERRAYAGGHDKGWYDAFRYDYPSSLVFDRRTGAIAATEAKGVKLFLGWRSPVDGRVKTSAGETRDVKRGDFIYAPLKGTVDAFTVTLQAVVPAWNDPKRGAGLEKR